MNDWLECGVLEGSNIPICPFCFSAIASSLVEVVAYPCHLIPIFHKAINVVLILQKNSYISIVCSICASKIMLSHLHCIVKGELIEHCLLEFRTSAVVGLQLSNCIFAALTWLNNITCFLDSVFLHLLVADMEFLPSKVLTVCSINYIGMKVINLIEI